MVNKTEGVKISVNNKGGNKEKKVKSKRPVRRVPAKAKRPPQKNKETFVKGNQKKKSGLFGSLIAIIVTALIVGGAIYAWQQKTEKEKISDLHNKTRSLRLEFEKQLEKVKNELTGVESENEELKNKKKELEEKASLLVGALKKYKNNDLGVGFEYPAIWGDVTLKYNEGETGTMFVGTFSRAPKLFFGGISVDFQPKATSTEINFLESSGYYKHLGHYYFQGVGDKKAREKEFTPAKEIETASGLVVLVDKNSFAVHAVEGKMNVGIDQNIGGIFNTDNDIYPGIVFLNKDLGTVSMEDFENLLSSLSVIKN